MSSVRGNYCCSVVEDAIQLNFVPGNEEMFKPQALSIEFIRTTRVPDNDFESELPPNMGKFPLFKIRDYAHRLPPEMVAKGGVFFPVYRKEAMWINFSADSPFMIKIYAGGVNVISGQHYKEDDSAGSQRLRYRGSLQDYVVVPKQLWLDGFAISPGVVRQFVAMPMGEGYSVEAQLTGAENIGGLQFEITPTTPLLAVPPYLRVTFETDTGERLTVPCSDSDSLKTIYEILEDLTGTPRNHIRLVYLNRPLYYESPRTTLGQCGITDGSIVKMRIECPSPGGAIAIAKFAQATPPPVSGYAEGGKVRQSVREDTISASRWMKDRTVTIPVQILDTAAFRQVTGTDPPPCPIDASTYAEAGLPFFKMYEEPSTVSGNFDAVKSINEIEQNRGIAQASESSVHPRLITLNERGHGITIPSLNTLLIHDPDSLMNPDGPLLPFRTVQDLKRDLGGSP
ncbi:hypothetical protein F5Y04DRAFT_288960 [Hypomontagnella monticulosa]|nr:hypothetical protein F5Y04DRAFT_288960 [Hypomontagnella monticulosa]